MTPPAGSKTVDELRQIAEKAGKPFILKGIMTVNGAKKALETGASGIVVSNHAVVCWTSARHGGGAARHRRRCGRQNDHSGGRRHPLRHGRVQALALGADAVLIGRPFVNMVYGGGFEGVQVYVDKLKAELADTMAMCGAHCLADIKRSMLYGY